MPVITIARELGSKGTLISKEAAKVLGVSWIDGQILSEAIETASVADVGLEPRDALLQKPDESSTPGERVAKLILGSHSAFSLKARLDDGAYFDIVQETIQGLAKKGDLLIIGRGGNLALADFHHVLKVKIVAPNALRVKQVMKTENLSHSEATRRVQESDKERKAFVKEAYGADWEDPHLYDLVINTEELSAEIAVDLIVSVAESKAVKRPAHVPHKGIYETITKEDYRVEEISQLLGMGRDVIRHAIFAGNLPAVRAGSQIIYVKREDLLRWLSSLG